jgi:hypothetical protein
MNVRDHEIDAALEGRVRSALRRSIVPPPTPEYVRYRVAAMSAATVHARRGLRWPALPVVRWTLRNAVAIRAVAALSIVAVLIGGGLMVWNARRALPAATPTFAGPVFDDGAVMLPQIGPNGVAYTYVDGTGLFITGDFGATWAGPRQLPAGNSSRDRLWDVGTLDFVDAEHGWMTRVANGPTGSDVVEYRTDDGGVTWTPASIASFSDPTSEDAFVTASQHFTDARHGRLIVAPAGATGGDDTCRTFLTADGGATWDGPTVGSCVGRLPEARWVSDLLGYAGAGFPGDARIATTMDGGATWVSGGLAGTWAQPEVRLLTEGPDGLAAVVQETAGDGSLPAVIMRSADGGRTWLRDHELAVPGGQGLSPFDDLSASSPSRWVGSFEAGCPDAASCPAGNVDKMMVSHDQGRSWTPTGSWLLDAAGLAWWDDLHGVVLAFGSQAVAPTAAPENTEWTSAPTRMVFVTEDGGLTWQAVPF